MRETLTTSQFQFNNFDINSPPHSFLYIDIESIKFKIAYRLKRCNNENYVRQDEINFEPIIEKICSNSSYLALRQKRQ